MKKIILLTLLFSASAFGYVNDCAKVSKIDVNIKPVMRSWYSSFGNREIEAALVDGCQVIVDKDNTTRCGVSKESIDLCVSFLNLGKK